MLLYKKIAYCLSNLQKKDPLLMMGSSPLILLPFLAYRHPQVFSVLFDDL
jgi:hypothetical protein